MPAWPWLVALAVVALSVIALYWLLVWTEGAYLGPRAVAALYNRVAVRYDRIKQFDDEDEAYFLGRPIARSLAGQPVVQPWLLDVAAGTGRLPLAVLRASEGGCRVIALDRADRMLAEARRKLGTQGWQDVVYLVHDAAPLPFADGQFPVVACLEALEFMPQPQATLGELLRVTQAGGLLVLSNRIGREARVLPGRTFSRDSLCAALHSLGAAGVEIVPWQMDYDLVMAVKQGETPSAESDDWVQMAQCPRCGCKPEPSIDAEQHALLCPGCGWRLVQRNGLWRYDGSSFRRFGRR